MSRTRTMLSYPTAPHPSPYHASRRILHRGHQTPRPEIVDHSSDDRGPGLSTFQGAPPASHQPKARCHQTELPPPIGAPRRAANSTRTDQPAPAGEDGARWLCVNARHPPITDHDHGPAVCRLQLRGGPRLTHACRPVKSGPRS